MMTIETGSRVLLSEKVTAELRSEKVSAFVPVTAADLVWMDANKKIETCVMCKKDAETNIIVGDGELMPVCLKCAETFDGRL